MSLLERIQDLCKRVNTNPSKLENELGLGKGTMYKWNKSSPNTGTLNKIADYFNVSTDYLLGKTDNPTSPVNDDIDINSLEFALYGEVKELTNEEIEDLIKFAQFIKDKRKK